MSEFAIRVKKLREETKHVSQAKMARDLAIDKSLISRWESGSRMPGWDMVSRIAKYFGVSTDYLYGISNDPTLQTLSDPDDAEFVSALSKNPKQCSELPEDVEAINTLVYNSGLHIIRLEGNKCFGVSGRNGMYEVSELDIAEILKEVSDFAADRLSRLEERKELEMLRNLSGDKGTALTYKKSPLERSIVTEPSR